MLNQPTSVLFSYCSYYLRLQSSRYAWIWHIECMSVSSVYEVNVVFVINREQLFPRKYHLLIAQWQGHSTDLQTIMETKLCDVCVILVMLQVWISSLSKFQAQSPPYHQIQALQNFYVMPSLIMTNMQPTRHSEKDKYPKPSHPIQTP